MVEHGPWKITASACKYQNEHLKLVEDDVIQPDGEPGKYACVEIKPGISAAALDEEEHIYLTRQFRYSLGRDSMEVVSGGLDGDEPPLEAARRELQEELGIRAETWTSLGRIDVDTSLVRSPGYLFLARRLTFSGSSLDGTEQIQRVRVPLAEAVRMVMDGEITHAPSAVLILKVARLRQES